jgi:filamentous hemagglutinin family protein
VGWLRQIADIFYHEKFCKKYVLLISYTDELRVIFIVTPLALKFNYWILMKTTILFSLLAIVGILPSAGRLAAQALPPSVRTPIPDNTLGTQVSASNNNFTVTGGLSRGQTLFQSFSDFSIPTGGTVNFNNLAGTRDIITRVTGNLFSDLNGTLNTQGANFLLINPAGVVFGPNAQLNVGKAFAASTANGVELLDGQGQRYTFRTNAGGDAPLLTINPNVFLNISRLNFGASTPGSSGIINYGTLQTANEGQYIGLIGGNVTLDGRSGGGRIVAPGGRVDLGGMNSSGTISIDKQGLVFTGNNFTRSDVSLLNGGQVNVAANQVLGNVSTFSSDVSNLGSRININANNLQIVNDRSTTNTASSNLSAGLNQNSGVKTTATGGINLDATGQVTLNNGTIFNTIDTGATGQLGDLNIAANSINIANGSNVRSQMNGMGNAGNINLKTTKDIAISGTNDPTLLQGDVLDNLSIISTSSAGQGNAGKISIDTPGNLSITNRGGISSFIGGTGVGNSQGVSINANNISVTNLSTIASSVFGGTGNAGNININTTGNLTILGANNRSLLKVNPNKLSFISSVNSGKGDTGKITINANNNLSANNLGGIYTSIASSGRGNSQEVNITAGKIDVGNFSTIGSNNGGIGNSGNINIKTTGDLTLSGTDNRSIIQGNETTPFSSILSDVNGQGNTGKITIDTKGNLSLDNVSVISSSVTVPITSTGNSQGISITAKNISLSNVSDINASVYSGTGGAGNIDIKTTGDTTISGTENSAFLQDRNNPFTITQIASFNKGIGNAGKITVDTQGNLSISNRGGIFATILTQGNSPGININAGNIYLSNLGVIESVVYAGGIGGSGNININSKGAVNLANTSRIFSSNQNQGSAADILIASEKIGLDSSKISAQSAGSTGGNIQFILNGQLLLRNTSSVSSTSDSTGKNGNGGNITIKSPLIIAAPGNNDISANAFAGNGGKVNISSQGLFGIQNRSLGSDSTNDITASSTFGQSGNINISTPGADPGKDSTELPKVTTDASNQISQVCSASNRQNKLTVAGRGGLPPNANDPLTSDVVWQDARAASSQPVASSATTNPITLAPPAVGWVFDGKGKVTLVAAKTQGQTGMTRVVCPNVK